MLVSGMSLTCSSSQTMACWLRHKDHSAPAAVLSAACFASAAHTDCCQCQILPAQQSAQSSPACHPGKGLSCCAGVTSCCMPVSATAAAVLEQWCSTCVPRVCLTAGGSGPRVLQVQEAGSSCQVARPRPARCPGWAKLTFMIMKTLEGADNCLIWELLQCV